MTKYPKNVFSKNNDQSVFGFRIMSNLPASTEPSQDTIKNNEIESNKVQEECHNQSLIEDEIEDSIETKEELSDLEAKEVNKY